jgi:formylglycine-generating enzyme required for sulfatase activity
MTELSSSPSNLLTNDEYKTTKMVLMRIPAGTFYMGSPISETGRWSNEDLHQVTLKKNYYMATFECTQAQYAVIMDGANPSNYMGSKHPVETVSWYDIRGGVCPFGSPPGMSFMGRLRAKTNRPFDLPTEAEWEYACRAGTTKAYNNDTDCLVEEGEDQDTNLDSSAWYGTNSSGSHMEVGTKQANAWGLYDMHGNVWEWCLDWTPSGPRTGPLVDPLGLSSGDSCMFCGGGWKSSVARHCRSASRNIGYGRFKDSFLGFRVLLPAGP